MGETNATPISQIQNVDENSTVDSIQLVVTQTESLAEIIRPQSNVPVEDKNNEEHEIPTLKLNEPVKIVIDDIIDDKPLASPARKSARLSAKRHDLISDSDILVTTRTDSPLPRRRSRRLSSTSSQDTPTKPRDEAVTKKLPTITENDKLIDQTDSSAENEAHKNEKQMVDELAAAFVEEFID